MVPSKRTGDPLKRRQVIHFDPDIRAGDHMVLGYDPMQTQTWKVAVNIRHPEGVKGVWWATLELGDPPDITVAGQTYSNRR